MTFVQANGFFEQMHSKYANALSFKSISNVEKSMSNIDLKVTINYCKVNVKCFETQYQILI